MIAVREIQDVEAGKVTVTLPADFNAKRVEIIVLPLEEPETPEESEGMPDSFRELLLKAPTLTDEELQEYEDVRAWMNAWRAEDL